MFNIGKVSLGVSTKKYSKPMSFDNNTTFSFGAVQPLFCQLLMAKASINVNARQLVRLAPLPVPTFARMKLINKYCFVPISDVYPAFENLMSGIPYTPDSSGNDFSLSSYVPTTLPFISNRVLLALVFGCGSDLSIWVKQAGSPEDTNNYGSRPLASSADTDDTLSKCKKAFLFRLHNNMLTDFSYPLDINFLQAETDDFVTPEGADYVMQVDETNNGAFGVSFLACVRFSQRAKRLRSIFLGLGYNLDFANDDKVNMLPLLAFYKAHYNNYELNRSSQWSTSYAYQIITLISQSGFTNFKNVFDGVLPSSSDSDFRKKLVGVFHSFIRFELSQCWFTYNDDYFSANRLSLTNNTQPLNFPFVNADGSVGDTFFNNSTSQNPNDSTLGKVTDVSSKLPFVGGDLSLIAFQVCQRLTRYVAKDSVIGRKMSDWVRTKFGADVANSLYKDVFNVSQSVLPIAVDDIFNVADTAVTDSGDGEVLGAYGGKGVAFDKSKVSFTAPYYGFFICISAIVPDSRYFQGCDASLYGIDKYTLPTTDWDALGFEVTPLGAVFGDNNICSDDLVKKHGRTSKGFGFMPRFSGYKVKKDIINGDMSRRATMDDLSPYYLDRIITNQNCHVQLNEAGNYIVDFTTESDIRDPQVLRYACRYPSIGNFNRIFYNSGSSAHGVSDGGEPLMDDNFIVQSVFDMRVSDGLKPISISYDTYEEETDNGTHDVKQD